MLWNARLGMLAGFGIGATVMYFLDAGRGGRRRALVRDKSRKASRQLGEAVQDKAEDTGNRVKGVVAEARAKIENAPATNHQLAARVCAELGHNVEHAKAIEVYADSGLVTLRGVALRDELDDIMRTVRRINGVRSVRNELSVHEAPGDIPALQS